MDTSNKYYRCKKPHRGAYYYLNGECCYERLKRYHEENILFELNYATPFGGCTPVTVFQVTTARVGIKTDFLYGWIEPAPLHLIVAARLRGDIS